jgi:hypothetical protein
MQAQTQSEMADMQRDQAKLQLDAQEFEHKKGVDLAEIELKQAELQIELEQERGVKVG